MATNNNKNNDVSFWDVNSHSHYSAVQAAPQISNIIDDLQDQIKKLQERVDNLEANKILLEDNHE
jgi:conjugal transfer/entry exclusion protein